MSTECWGIIHTGYVILCRGIGSLRGDTLFQFLRQKIYLKYALNY